MAKPWEKEYGNPISNENSGDTPTKDTGYLESFFGGIASDTLSLEYAKQQRDIWDKIRHNDYRDEAELNSLEQRFLELVDLEENERQKQAQSSHYFIFILN